MSAFTTAEASACEQLVSLALAEDLGPTGDRTTLALISANRHGRAAFTARSDGVIAGWPTIACVIARFGTSLDLAVEFDDGHHVAAGRRIGMVEGSLREILFVERTCLNFLQRLSGIATLARKYVDAVSGTKATILDTRKTTPGWRLLEKYAVRMGGGTNHRLGLYDGILIKDNHIAGLGNPTTAVRRAVELARAFPGNQGLPVEVEVDSLEQLEQVMPVRPEIVLLDNMSLEKLRSSVALRDRLAPKTLLEASGGVNLSTVRTIAETGVDRISVGALTHSAPALDIALDYQS